LGWRRRYFVLLRWRVRSRGERVSYSQWGERLPDIAVDSYGLAGLCEGSEHGGAGEVKLGHLDGLAGLHGGQDSVLLYGERWGWRGAAGGERFGESDLVGVVLRGQRELRRGSLGG
jgi:hypothetical protein